MGESKKGCTLTFFVSADNVNRVGMMQGRLSPLINGRIQSFPKQNWEVEMMEAPTIGIGKIEWTIDSDDFFKNPLITREGNAKILSNEEKSTVRIPSVTCDYFMENPPWQSDRKEVQKNIRLILQGMSTISARILVIPLVDNSAIKRISEMTLVIDFFNELVDDLAKHNLEISFETDLGPQEFANFIENFHAERFFVNYDVGNSASLGFNPKEEFDAFGSRINNVHVKDRILNGMTVPLGEGAADFEFVFDYLKKVRYEGNFILQTARAQDGNHASSIIRYRNQVLNWLGENN